MGSHTIFLDGHLLRAQEPLIDSLTPGRILGKGVFETMRVYERKIFAFKDHFVRLKRGLAVYNIKLIFSQNQMKNAISKILKCNRIRNGRLRLCVWEEAQEQHICLVAQNIKPPLMKIYNKGFKAKLASEKRLKTKFSGIKSLDYSLFQRAYEEAQGQGYDEALLRNKRGFLVEGTRSNIFLIREGQLFTPSISDGCLDGITRKYVFQLAERFGLKVKSHHITPVDLIEADEAFVTNSLLEIMPLTRLGTQKINRAHVGLFTKGISKAYHCLVRESLNLS